MTAPALTDGIDTEGAADRPRGATGPPHSKRADPLAELVKERWEAGGEVLAAARKDYWINLAFYLRDQWVWWDRKRNIVQSLPQAYSPLGPGRVRLTVNRLGPNILNLLGRLLKSELSFEVTPSDSADNIVSGARTGEKVIESAHMDQGWESIRFDELFASFLGGTSAVCIEWDGTAGTQIEYDQATDQVTGTGDVRLRSLNVNEFCLEPNVRTWRDARWWIMGLALPVTSVKEQYDLPWTPLPDANISGNLKDKLLEGSGRAYGKNLCHVLCYYERPNKGSKGRYVVVVNDTVVAKEAWPFPFDELNVHPFRQRRIDGKWYGTTLMNDAVPIQVAYNQARSVLAEHMKLAGNARLTATMGSIEEEDVTDNVGGILFYSPDVGGAGPQYLSPPSLPAWLREEADTLKSELDDICHVHDISRGQGFDRASGQALALLSEKDDSPLGSMAFEQREGWSRIGTLALQLYGAKSQESRKSVLRAAPGISETVTWSGKMLQGQYNVSVPLDAVQPKTQAARLAFAKDLWDRKIVSDPRMYARMVGLPPDEFEQLLDSDAAKANRENLRIAMGVVEFPDSFDNHAVHIAEHNRWRKSDAYKYAEMDVRKLADDHITYHERKAEDEFAAQAAKAQVNPELAALPQAGAPAGSMLPLPAAEQQALDAAQMGVGPGQGNAPPGGDQGSAGGGDMELGAGDTTPALAAGMPSAG